MRRRELLSALTVALAGCTGSGNDGSGGDGSNGNGTTTAASVRLVDATLRTLDSGCGQQRDSAEVRFESSTVRVEGTIWGSDTCKAATLREASYDAGRLTLDVGTKNREGIGKKPGCGQCIVELDYRVRATFEGGLPPEVAVVHHHGDGGTEVTVVQR